MSKVYQILEVANCHGGDLDYLQELIEEYKEYTGNFGMKFQPFQYDKIATADFEWYPVYQALFFTAEQWRTILEQAHQTKEVWLDLFDEYSIEILTANLDLVAGIKLQPSVINNISLINRLSALDLSTIRMAVNISGFSMPSIQLSLAALSHQLNTREMLIEVGFQAYPTSVSDAGLNKIQAIKEMFSNRIVFADHVDGKSEDALWLPVMAVLQGADVIEKHIMHSSRETKYDHYSALTKERYDALNKHLALYDSVLDEPFINKREEEYLKKTVQIPVAKRGLAAGETISFAHDMEFRRSGKKGLSYPELKKLTDEKHVVSHAVKAGDVLHYEDLHKAVTATIIAGRLKSTRLPRKAVLKIGELSSIELCIKNCLRFNTNHTVLATSVTEEDAELSNYTYRPDVIFHTGDPDDVIRRYLSVCDQLQVNVVVRVTADMPFVSREIFELLLQSHFEHGADFTYAREAAVGTAPEIINVTALKKVKEYFPDARYSEYMSWYFKNNPEHFKLNAVALPASLVRDYRLTLDYEEDLVLFNKISENINKQDASIESIFEFLDNNSSIAAINAGISLKYLTDKDLIALLNRETKMISN